MVEATSMLEEEAKKYEKIIEEEPNEQDILPSLSDNQDEEIIVTLEYYEAFIQKGVKLKRRSWPFKNKDMIKFSQNRIIVEKMLLENNQSLEEVAKWLRLPLKRLKICIDKYFRWKKLNEAKSLQKKRDKVDRLCNLKRLFEIYIANKKGRCVTVKSIKDFANSKSKENEDIPSYSYDEVRSCLKNTLGYSWQRSNTRPPSSLRSHLKDDKEIFKSFIRLLEKCHYTIVYIDECSFNASALPLYTWNKIGDEPVKLIRSTNQRFNCIAAQVEQHKIFHIKTETTKDQNFITFLEKLNSLLKTMIAKKQLMKRTVYVFDNASIHSTEKVVKAITGMKMVCFTIPPYSPELNKIEHTFGTLKRNLSRENLANKEFLHNIKMAISRV
uniref:ORF1 n=1 Tax=Euplotes crassus TaxID=5936 RepID=V9GZS5_EUPCR|nr:ORF1 [Moneuplotes crassus]